MDRADQDDIDARIQTYYDSLFVEAERLTSRSLAGRLELVRTQELVAAHVPPRSRIVDVGGATGIHAAPLAATGHDVVLLDPVPSQVAQAAAHGTFEAVVGDARDLPFPDDDYDAALLLGPLYHLASAADRSQALREAARVVRPGGVVLAAAIPRLVRLASMTLGAPVPDPWPESWTELLTHGTAPRVGRFPGGHFHTGEELEDELAAAGLVEVEVVAIEGVAGLALEVDGADDRPGAPLSSTPRCGWRARPRTCPAYVTCPTT